MWWMRYWNFYQALIRTGPGLALIDIGSRSQVQGSTFRVSDKDKNKDPKFS